MKIFFYIQIDHEFVAVAEARNIRMQSREVDFWEDDVFFKTAPIIDMCLSYEGDDIDTYNYTFWLEDKETAILNIDKKMWKKTLIEELFKRADL